MVNKVVFQKQSVGMAVADITEALEAAVEAIVKNEKDIHAIGGEIH